MSRGAIIILLIPLAYELLSLILTHRFTRGHRDPDPQTLPPVTLLKPLKGGDDRTFDNLATLACLNYPAYEIVLVVASPDDPAVPHARRLIEEYPDREIRLVIDPTVHGANPKVSSLINASTGCRHDIIAISDADVRMEPGYLQRVVGWFDDPSVGMVTSLYRHPDPPDLPGELESLLLDTEMIPNVIVAHRLEGITFGLGASMVLRRSALVSIGGFVPLADFLADDYHLGNLIHRKGWKVVLSRSMVHLSQGRESLRDFLRRHVRWGKTMRVSRPGGYLASGVTRIGVMTPIALAVAADEDLLWGVLPVIYPLHLLTLLLIHAWVGGRVTVRGVALLPLRDILSGVIWLSAFIGNRIVWRGESYRMVRGGKLERG